MFAPTASSPQPARPMLRVASESILLVMLHIAGNTLTLRWDEYSYIVQNIVVSQYDSIQHSES